MAIPLVDGLRETLADWQEDLSSSWRAMFADLKLDFAAVNPALRLFPWEPIFPSRRRHPIPGAPKGAHVFRAFDDIEPEQVRCVVIGQDPYPCPAFSTGRAFEAGGCATWRELEKMFSHSMRALLQFVCAARGDDESYAANVRNWPRAIDSIEAGRVMLPPPARLARHWVEQGVLLLNSSLTLSRFSVAGDPHQLEGHLPLWRPLIARVVRRLAASKASPPVFMLFGASAKAALAAGQVATSEHNVVVRKHPAAGDEFLAEGNPFKECNEKLAARGLDPIEW